MKKIFSKPLALLFIPLVIFFSFGLYHLTDFVTSDEHYWFGEGETQRIGDYWQAIGKHDWKGTRINDKPGITLAYVSGVALLFDKNPSSQIISSDGFAVRFSPERTKEINFLYRFPILLLSGLFSFYFFWIIRKITESDWIALYSTTFILLSPIIVGMSQIVNPDSMFWIFTSATIFTFLAYLKSPEKKLVALTTLFFGLAMASKYVAFIFIPFGLFMILAWFFMEFDKWKGEQDEFGKRIARSLLSHLTSIIGGIAIFSIMMPAVFTDIRYFSENTIGSRGMIPVFWAIIVLDLIFLAEAHLNRGRILFYMFDKLGILRDVLPKILYFILGATFIFVLINWMSRHSLVNLKNIPFDMKLKDKFNDIPFFRRYLVEFVPLAFSLTPFAIFSLFYIWVKGYFEEARQKTTVFIISSFMLIFFLAVISQGLLLQIRYSMILYSMALFLCGIAVHEFFAKDEREGMRSGKRSKITYLTILFLTLGTYFVSRLIQHGLLNEKLTTDFLKFHTWIWAVALAFCVVVAFFAVKWIVPKKLEIIGNGAVAFSGIVAVSLISLWLIKPFYFNYTSSLLPQKYMITAAWGYGGYEAAQHLNALPNAQNLTLWADSYGFCEFFVGKCIHKSKYDITKYTVDYYYNTLRGQLRPKVPHPKVKSPVWKMTIDGRGDNFLKIYKAAPIKTVQE